MSMTVPTLVLLILSVIPMAGKPAPSSLADSYQTFDTPRAAAIAGLRSITGKKVESGGGILYNKEQNKYAYTEPVGQADGAHFAASVRVPQGWALNSTYHTHPAGPQSTQFSDDDINTAQQLKAPSYVLAHFDNKIRMFDPASSPISKNVTGRFSPGSLVDESKPLPAPAPTSPTQVADVGDAKAAAVPVSGSRIMRDFASRHRTQTTKYRPQIVHVKIGAPKRP